MSLAPLWGVAPVFYPDLRFKGTGHTVNDRFVIDWVDVDDLGREALSRRIDQVAGR